MSVKADGKPGGPRTAVQFDDAGAFGGDAGLTYDKATKELTVAGNTDKTTPLLTAHAGDFRASATVVTGVPDADVLYTAVAVGTSGNAIVINYRSSGANQSLTIAVVGSDITANLATDGGATVTSTASDVIAAINGDVSANVLVTASLAPGNDGSGIVSSFAIQQLAGGALAADVAWIDERGVINVQLQTGLGLDAINIRDPNGVIVGHLDNDGGFGFASDHFLMSQTGNMSVDAQVSLPLSGAATLRYSINGYAMFVIAAGGGFGFFVSSPVSTDVLFAVAAGTGQTGDLFAAFDENFAKTVRILSNGDLQFDQATLGPILIDRTTATRYRLFVDSGVLGIEVV